MELIRNDNLKETGKLPQEEEHPVAGSSGELPLVSTLGFDEIKTYAIASRSDAEQFTGKPDLPDEWFNLPEDDLKPVMPRLLMGLQYAVKYFCDTLQGVCFNSFGLDSMLNKSLNILLYRCICELINNALQHAGATHIFVQLSLGKEVISITVNDDGCGFDPEKAIIGSGLGNICACVVAYNGQMSIFTSEGQGTEITIDIEQPRNTESHDKNTYSRPSQYAD
ncbi:MAG: hypothetical protein LBS88_11680 [Tannerellaceae bacterium]|nr:hypothetical protein [Tannerellaceae bacterium]